MTDVPRIEHLEIIPVAFRDLPLLAASGMHQPWSTRTILRLHCQDGTVGLSETYGDKATLDDLEAISEALKGLRVTDHAAVRRIVQARVAASQVSAHHPLLRSPRTDPALRVARIFGAVEVACIDAQARAADLPVCEVLGGRYRDEVPFSAYLFYKPATHPGLTDLPDDGWGEVLTPEQMVGEARQMVDRFGFRSLKLKGGVLDPQAEMETLRQLRAAFPDHPLRIDPNANWSVETTLSLMDQMEGMLEYLEDPVFETSDMAQIQAAAPMPLATNMCVTGMHEVREAVMRDGVRVILTDHHFWGGLRETTHLAAICNAFGLGVSMHSNTHLGVSLMAMVHVAAACENITYDCDTHYSWLRGDLVKGGLIPFRGGAVKVPDAPGIGVELDDAALAAMAEDFVRLGVTHRDDTKFITKLWPDWTPERPRF